VCVCISIGCIVAVVAGILVGILVADTAVASIPVRAERSSADTLAEPPPVRTAAVARIRPADRGRHCRPLTGSSADRGKPSHAPPDIWRTARRRSSLNSRCSPLPVRIAGGAAADGPCAPDNSSRTARGSSTRSSDRRSCCRRVVLR